MRISIMSTKAWVCCMWPQTRVRWAIALLIMKPCKHIPRLKRHCWSEVVTFTYTETETLQLQSALTTDGVLQTEAVPSFHCSLFTCSRPQSSRYFQLHNSVWQKLRATVIPQQATAVKDSQKVRPVNCKVKPVSETIKHSQKCQIYTAD